MRKTLLCGIHVVEIVTKIDGLEMKLLILQIAQVVLLVLVLGLLGIEFLELQELLLHLLLVLIGIYHTGATGHLLMIGQEVT